MNKTRKSWKYIALWIASALVAIIMMVAGWAKVADAEMLVHNFSKWGYPHWFRYAVGTLEIVSSVLLLMPKFRVYGASVIGGLLIGAVWTHVAAGEYFMIPIPGILLVLSGIILVSERSRLLKILNIGRVGDRYLETK